MTPHLFRLWVGPDHVALVADECREQGLFVPFVGSEHVYVLHQSLAPDYSEHRIVHLLRPYLARPPVLWATLTHEDAAALRHPQEHHA